MHSEGRTEAAPDYSPGKRYSAITMYGNRMCVIPIVDANVVNNICGGFSHTRDASAVTSCTSAAASPRSTARPKPKASA